MLFIWQKTCGDIPYVITYVTNPQLAFSLPFHSSCYKAGKLWRWKMGLTAADNTVIHRWSQLVSA